MKLKYRVNRIESAIFKILYFVLWRLWLYKRKHQISYKNNVSIIMKKINRSKRETILQKVLMVNDKILPLMHTLILFKKRTEVLNKKKIIN